MKILGCVLLLIASVYAQVQPTVRRSYYIDDSNTNVNAMNRRYIDDSNSNIMREYHYNRYQQPYERQVERSNSNTHFIPVSTITLTSQPLSSSSLLRQPFTIANDNDNDNDSNDNQDQDVSIQEQLNSPQLLEDSDEESVTEFRPQFRRGFGRGFGRFGGWGGGWGGWGGGWGYPGWGWGGGWGAPGWGGWGWGAPGWGWGGGWGRRW